MWFAQSGIPFWMAASAVLLSHFCLCGCGTETADKTAVRESPQSAGVPDFSEEVQTVLDRRIRLIEKLAAEELVVNAVREANRKSGGMSKKEIARLDQQWQAAEELNDLIKSLITNECARFMVDFQEDNDGFPEIFVTDAMGLVVAATNRTSDYLQSDESWWRMAYNDGQGRSHHGEIEYDESAHSESISLHVPVIDRDSGKAIGVLKAVCDITAIKMEL
jgi:hypothetical protein